MIAPSKILAWFSRQALYRLQHHLGRKAALDCCYNEMLSSAIRSDAASDLQAPRMEPAAALPQSGGSRDEGGGGAAAAILCHSEARRATILLSRDAE